MTTKFTKLTLTVMFILGMQQTLFAQQWDGPNNTTGSITRSGDIGLIRTTFGIAQLSIVNTNAASTHYSSYWRAGAGNIDSQTRLLLSNPNAGTGFVNGLYVGLDQAFAVKSYTIGSKDATPLAFYTSGSERLRIHADGSMLLNKNEFGVSQLEISNTAENSTNYSSYWRSGTGGNIDSQTRLLIRNPNAGSGFTNGLYVGLDQAYTNKSYTIGSKDATPLCFYSSGTERIRITSDGKVGIGTNIPDHLLSVNGKMNAEELKVVVQVPGDYVFEPDYQLMPLSEVEAYVNTNKHLPGVPDAATIIQDGWEVGKMSNKLLEKIEELTLYMIEMKKENDELKGKVTELKERVAALEMNK